jgi:hypothetical protein
VSSPSPRGVLSDRSVSPCDDFPPLPFIDARVSGKRGTQICATVLWSWEVFSHVVVCQEALKGANLWWSLWSSRVWEVLFISGT